MLLTFELCYLETSIMFVNICKQILFLFFCMFEHIILIFIIVIWDRKYIEKQSVGFFIIFQISSPEKEI